MDGADVELVALGDRLVSAARGVMVAGGCRTGHELVEKLSLEGTTARRVVRLCADGVGGEVALTRSPSAAHLQRMANQAKTKGVDEGVCLELHEAAGAYAGLLKARGVSRAALTKGIRDRLGDVGAGND